MRILINLILFIAIAGCIWPQFMLKTLKKIFPAVLLISGVLVVAFGIQQLTVRKVTITALDQKNESSGGTEIWLKSVIVEGKEFSPEEYFSEGWIAEDNFYKWRNYEIPNGKLSKSISAVFNTDSEVVLVLDSNKWRGQVRVKYGLQDTILDCYNEKATDDYEFTVNIPKLSFAFALSWENVFIIFSGILLLLYTYFRFFSSYKKDRSYINSFENRQIWLDLLKVIASFFIIMIHSSGNAYNVVPNRSLNYIFALLVNSVTRCAVPIFIMISGSLLIKEQVDIKKSLMKAKQALIALVIWNAIYIFIDYIRGDGQYNLIDAIIQIPLKRGPSGHLWYGYLLVWIYLFTPIVSAIYYGMDRTLKKYFFIITIVVMGTIDIIVKISLLKGIENPLRGYSIYMQLIYIAIMMLGKYIIEHGDDIPYKGIKSFAISIISLAVTIILTIYLTKKTGKSQHEFFSEVCLSNIIYGAGLLWLCSCFKHKIQQIPIMIKKYIVSMSSVCLGIYYGHGLLTKYYDTVHIANVRVSLSDDANIVSFFVMWCLYFLVSWGTASLLRAIPFLKKIVS